ncbi:MAG: O-methyltransferase [Proteobacteria bacterium]|nr:O-methyltransferase [Pseudomonadota bacterium]
MDPKLWTRIDEFLEARLVRDDDALQAAVRASADAGLPDIAVTPTQGKLLQLLAQVAGARRVLEIGSLGGFSTIWLARGLEPGGHVVSLELDPGHAAIARANLERAGLGQRVTIRIGAALDTLPALAAERAAPFDLVFIDADKERMADYVDWAVRLGRTGTLIVIDNVVRAGGVLDAHSADAAIVGTRRAFDFVAAHPRLSATAVQTVGRKGHDGWLVARVNAPDAPA